MRLKMTEQSHFVVIVWEGLGLQGIIEIAASSQSLFGTPRKDVNCRVRRPDITKYATKKDGFPPARE